MNRLFEKQLNEMARVGTFNKYNVSVYSGEGNIPHFHFYNIETNTQGCIRIDKAEYFSHNGKEAKLNSRQIKDLIEWLNSKHGFLKITMWEYILVLWNDNNINNQIKTQISMPDYTKLNENN